MRTTSGVLARIRRPISSMPSNTRSACASIPLGGPSVCEVAAALTIRPMTRLGPFEIVLDRRRLQRQQAERREILELHVGMRANGGEAGARIAAERCTVRGRERVRLEHRRAVLAQAALRLGVAGEALDQAIQLERRARRGHGYVPVRNEQAILRIVRARSSRRGARRKQTRYCV